MFYETFISPEILKIFYVDNFEAKVLDGWIEYYVEANNAESGAVT